MLPRFARASLRLLNLDRSHSTAQPQHYLFLLSHMRSYSSLLAHILGSSPDINGYGETHLKYKRKVDLWRLRREIRRSTGDALQGQWLLDKILHNYIQHPDRFLTSERVRAVIFVRQPETTLRSMLTMAQLQTSEPAIRDPEIACDYYVSRLHRLRADGQRLGKQALYFDAELLTQQPGKVLAGLGSWLQLRTPLPHQYRIGNRTGESGFGDPLHNIRSGEILDSSSSTIDRSMSIPTTLLDEANAAYVRCRNALLQCCSLIPASTEILQSAQQYTSLIG